VIFSISQKLSDLNGSGTATESPLTKRTQDQAPKRLPLTRDSRRVVVILKDELSFDPFLYLPARATFSAIEAVLVLHFVQAFQANIVNHHSF
jgi:hypothetical protein